MSTETRVDVEAIRERLEKATPGPWTLRLSDSPYGHDVFGEIGCEGRIDEGPHVGKAFRQANAEAIAHAPTDIAALLDEIARYRELAGVFDDAGWRCLASAAGLNHSERAALVALRTLAGEKEAP